MRKLAGVLVLVIAVHAADPQVAQLMKAIVASVKAGRPGNVTKVLRDGAIRALSEEPKLARKAAEACAKYARKTAKKDTEGWRDLSNKMVRVGRSAVSNDGEDKDALIALAEALVCKGRIADETGGAADKTTWSEAADLYERADKIKSDGGEWLERAVAALREGAATGLIDLEQRAEELDTKAKEAQAATPGGKAKGELDAIRRLIRVDKKAAKARLEAHLAALQLKLDPLNPDLVLATAFNDAVTLAKQEKKLYVKAKYLARKLRSRYDWLEFELPIGKRWTFERTSSDFGTILQVGDDAEKVLVILFTYYRHTTEYTIGPRGFGGDNVKGLALLDEKNAEDALVQVKYRRKLRKGRFNRHITKSSYFEIGGIDSDGDFRRTRAYYWKPKHVELRTLCLYMVIFGDLAKFDPEAEFVIDSIRAPKKKRR